ncbi:archease [Microbulbifer flavimaris]|uniref:Archease n=1 Tax=Microbulbifer flavimaris TaxID=1781068 RepID=A0ABX4I1F9_9GAMM|nr:archease [Microbulbifer sp. ZGT114]PCO06252.1 archease [Microbulbifer flavimaris]
MLTETGARTPVLPAHWEHFSHEADMGVRGVGDSLAEAFAQVALAMTAIITDPSMVRHTERVDIHCACPDRELLLVDWLNALVYEMACRNMLFSRFQIQIEDGSLSAAAWGEPVERKRHRPIVEVKGATYTALRVNQQKDGSWIAQCVVDV